MAYYEAIAIILSLISIAFAIFLRALFKNRKTLLLPPSPPGLPIIGHIHLLAPTPHKALYNLSIRYGPFFRIILGSKPCVVISSPEIAKEFLKTREISFSNRAKIDSVDCLTYGTKDFAFAPYGPYWKFMKKLCMSELLGSKTLHTLHFIRREEIKKLFDVLSEKSNAQESVDLKGELLRLVNNVITRMTMSKSCSKNEDEAREVRKLITEMAAISGKFNIVDYYPIFKSFDFQGIRNSIKKIRAPFDEMMDRIIEEHKEGKKKKMESDGVKDLVDILLEISEDKSSEIQLTKENIKAFIMDVFSGGTDTTTITTEWALAELINHPDIMNKARQEIDSVVGNERLVDESDIENLPLIQAIVKETLRLHTPAPLILRESTEDCTIEGYHIKRGTRVFVNVWALGRDPKYWEDPLQFVPERFLTQEGSRHSNVDVKGQQFHFLPFGSGRRGCPGISLALKIVQTTIAVMIQCFDWKVFYGQNGDSCVDMEEGPGINLPKAKPLVCVPIARIMAFPSM